MIVYLPMNFQISALNRFTSSIVGQNGLPTHNEISLDFSKLNFIDGGGFTVLMNSVEWLIHNGTEVKFRNFNNISRPAIEYLDDCGFFKNYIHKNLRPGAKLRPTTLPCTKVEQAHSFGWVEYKLSPWLESILEISYGSLASIRACIKEILNNIGDHSTIHTGFVHAQHYPNKKSIVITVSDFGAGIPQTIRARYGPMPDENAILHATREGVTAKSQPNNMGAGLSYLVDTVRRNRGIARLHSLAGNLTCLCDTQGELVARARRGTGRYPGTLIEVELDTRLFVGDEDDRTDFEW